jgi:hypothetical protein
MTAVVLLHDLGADDAGAPWRAAAPPGWVVPDLPGHGEAAAPRHGAYDPMGPATLARWALQEAGGGTVVGVGQNALGALILAAGGACEQVVVVDGLGGPWSPPQVAIAETYATLRAIVSDGAAHAPPPPAGLDPRTRHGYGVHTSPAFAQRFWGSIRCPVLAVETPGSTTPSHERPERVGWFGGPAALVEVPDGAPDAVVAAVLAAWGLTEGDRSSAAGPPEDGR